jgi:hypothetical protein
MPLAHALPIDIVASGISLPRHRSPSQPPLHETSLSTLNTEKAAATTSDDGSLSHNTFMVELKNPKEVLHPSSPLHHNPQWIQPTLNRVPHHLLPSLHLAVLYRSKCTHRNSLVEDQLPWRLNNLQTHKEGILWTHPMCPSSILTVHDRELQVPISSNRTNRRVPSFNPRHFPVDSNRSVHDPVIWAARPRSALNLLHFLQFHLTQLFTSNYYFPNILILSGHI